MRRGFSGTFTLTPRKPEHWWSPTCYDFRLSNVTPLTWHDGTLLAQPDRHFVTDGGSIPKLVQCIPAFDGMRYSRPYAMHDSAYKNHCWYEASLEGVVFRRRPLSRVEADYWLREMLLADGATRATAQTVYRFVRMFGWMAW